MSPIESPIATALIVAGALGVLIWLACSIVATHNHREHEYEAAVSGAHYCEARKGGGRCGRPAGPTPTHTTGGDYHLCTRCATEVHALRGWGA